MDFIKKIAETVEMSIAIPDSEKGTAGALVSILEKLSVKYDGFNTLLDKIYNPFSGDKEVSKESVENNKKPFMDYKKEIDETLREIEQVAMLCVEKLIVFSSDTDINELLTSFKSGIDQIKDNVRILGDALVSWDSDDFKDMVVKSIENLKKDINNSRELINDRIISHINENILGKSWVDEIGKEMNLDIKDKEPMIKELYREREIQLQEMGY